jgi:hypothetical protein
VCPAGRRRTAVALAVVLGLLGCAKPTLVPVTMPAPVPAPPVPASYVLAPGNTVDVKFYYSPS